MWWLYTCWTSDLKVPGQTLTDWTVLSKTCSIFWLFLSVIKHQNEIYISSFQACTELTLPAGSNNKTDMFPPLPWTPEMIATYCKKKWGVVPQPNWAPIQFWGKG